MKHSQKLLSLFLSLVLLLALLPLSALGAAALTTYEIHISSNGNYGRIELATSTAQMNSPAGAPVRLDFFPEADCVMTGAYLGERTQGVFGPMTEYDYDHPIAQRGASSAGFTMPAHDVYIRVDFLPTSSVYRLYISDKIQHGTVATADGGDRYLTGETVQLEVVPDRGYALRSVNYGQGPNPKVWIGIGTTTSFKMPEYDTTVKAEFQALPSYEISASVSAEGGGTVTGGGTWYRGEEVKLTATPAAGYVFANWTENGNVVSEDAVYTFEASAYRTLTANFRNPNKAYISASVSAEGGGTVTGGGTCQAGNSVTLTATPDANYAFVNWTKKDGTEVSKNAAYTFTAEAGYHTLTANFIRTYDIAASASNAYGNVTGGGTYRAGDGVTLTAAPTASGAFVHWEEAGAIVSTDAAYTFTADRDRTLAAIFKQAGTYTISATVANNVGGTITGLKQSYNEGETVTLTATPTANSNYYFAYWEGANQAAVCADPTYTFTAEADRSLKAHFIACTPWTDPNHLPSPEGCYVLTCNLSLGYEDTTMGSGTFHIVLNGYKLELRGGGINLYDTNLSVYGSGNFPSIHCNSDNCTFNMYGVTIDKNSGRPSTGVSLPFAGNVCNMYGGKIADCTDATSIGSRLNGGTFNMYGGTISGNKNGSYNKGTFNLFGGTISDNSGSNHRGWGGLNIAGGEIISTVTLSDGVSAEPPRIAATYGKKLPPVTVPERAHCSFGGYYTEGDGGGTQVFDADGNFKPDKWENWNNATLFAKWTPDDFTLTFEPNGGTLTGGTSMDYTVESTEELPEPIKEHAEFTGWRVSTAGGSWTENEVFDAGTALTGRYGDATLTAQWMPKNYTVKWQRDYDDYVLSADTVPYGTVPAYSGAEPTKPVDASHGYAFSGWDKEIVAVTGDVTYKTVFTEVPRSYTVRFLDEDGKTVLQTGEVLYGATPAYEGTTPTKAADAQYTYAFSCWAPEITAVTGDADYTATYAAMRNSYTVRFVDEDGTDLQSGLVAYGETPEYTGETPTKAADAQYSYTFAGWTPKIAAVTGEATYTATYSKTPVEYTIRFVNEDGTELQSGLVAYGETPEYTGETPTKAATAQHSYTFAGWTPALAAVTGEATYTATYTEAPRMYMIRFVNEDGKELQSGLVAYGEMPKYTGATPKKLTTAQYSYTFAGWTPELTAVTGEATYTATYTATERSDGYIPAQPTQPTQSAEGFDAVDTSRGGSLENFKASGTYTEEMFNDANPEGWYADNLKTAVEYGLMLGNDDGTFGVGKPLKLSETLAIAARLHNLFYGGSGKFDQTVGDTWYAVYANYAERYGFLPEGQYDLDSVATRAQFAEILSAALPDAVLAPVVDKLPPDVTPDHPVYAAIVRLYAAGIVNGVDELGSFDPDAPIPREQIAAMVTRVVIPALRVAE